MGSFVLRLLLPLVDIELLYATGRGPVGFGSQVRFPPFLSPFHVAIDAENWESLPVLATRLDPARFRTADAWCSTHKNKCFSVDDLQEEEDYFDVDSDSSAASTKEELLCRYFVNATIMWRNYGTELCKINLCASHSYAVLGIVSSRIWRTFILDFRSRGRDNISNQGCGSGSGLDPDSEDFVDPDPYWESGSGSRGKKIKKFQWKKCTF
jgi:hypothetical protein